MGSYVVFIGDEDIFVFNSEEICNKIRLFHMNLSNVTLTACESVNLNWTEIIEPFVI